MTREIVKYDNEFNNLKLTNFNAKELDMLMLMCAKMKNLKADTMEFDFEYLKSKLDMKHEPDQRFLVALEMMNKKLMNVTCNFKTESKHIMFVLFTTFVTDFEKKTLQISVNEKFTFLLNELTKNFTRFELEEFSNLKSKYSKNLYRLLKQYRRTGTYKVSAEEFKELIGCPKAYANKKFMEKIIKPALDELSHGFFEGLQVVPIKAKKRGAPIIAYEFTFKATEEIPGQMHLADYIQKKKNSKSKNDFNNFPQHKYDFEVLEKMLLNE